MTTTEIGLVDNPNCGYSVSWLGPNSCYVRANTVTGWTGNSDGRLLIPAGQHRMTVRFPGIIAYDGAFEVYSPHMGEGSFHGEFHSGFATMDFQADLPLADTYCQLVLFRPYGTAISAIQVTVVFEAVPGETVPTLCAYGTRLKAGFPSLVALAPSTILTIAGLFSKGFRTTLAMFFAGRIVDTADLCSTLPPDVPVIEPIDIVNLTTYIAFGLHQDAFDKFWTWILAMIWPTFCECVPGTPDPVAPTPPDPTSQPDLPVFGPQPCDNSDICALLMETKEELDGMYGFLAMLRSEVQAMQSQMVPFSYVAGAMHSGLSGQGEFAVSGILGLSVEFTTVPLHLSRREDDPLTVYGLGEIGLGTDDGWQQSRKCSHNPQLVLPIGPEVTRVAYTFAGGAVANILELVRRT